MDSAFPFGFPQPTAFYFTLYVGTLVVHVLFMSYVLAGTAYLAVRGLFRHGADSPLSAVLRDWMPFMLSAAITAGIAPLLFVQILYPHRFYTANVLLFYRWGSIVPVLIVGFYMLYLLRSEHERLRRTGVRLIVGLIAFLCFGFIAWSWTENHLLSVQGLDVWRREYVSEGVIFHTPELAPRLALWFCGTFPTMALVLAWQLWWLHGPSAARATPRTLEASGAFSGGMSAIPGTRRTAFLALTGLLLSGVCAGFYFRALEPAQRDAVTGAAARVYLGLVLAGWAVQVAGWGRQYAVAAMCRSRLLLITAGLVSTILGVAVVRECVRISRIDMAALLPQHLDAAEKGGLPVFAAFLAINAVAIACCIRLVLRTPKSPAE